MMRFIFALVVCVLGCVDAHASPLTVQSYPAFVQRPLGSMTLCKPGVAACSASITVNDAAGPTSIQVGWMDAAGNPITGFSGAPGTTVAGGQLTIALGGGPIGGGPFTPYAKDMTTGAIYSGAPTLVGDLWIYGGQSNGQNMWATASPSPPLPSSKTKMYLGGWTAPTGDGAITFLNELSACSGIPQAINAVALGGTALTYDGVLSMYLNGLSGSLDNWLNTSSTLIWGPAVAAINATDNNAAGIVFHQGESDTLGVSSDTYAQGLSRLRRNFASVLTKRAIDDTPFVLIELGYYQPWAAQGEQEAAVRNGERMFAETTPRAFIGARQYDLARDSSNIHLTPASLAQVGKRLAYSICRNVYGR